MHPVVDKEGEEGRAVNVVTKFRALQHNLKQRNCTKKLQKLQALVENILKLPKEMLKKGSGRSLKSLGE